MGITTARRRRALAILPVSTALIATAFIGLPAQAAVTGPIDCPDALPTADAVKGLTGTGFTVSQGDTPQAFTATVLGRIKDGIAPGVDMIMADLDSPALQAAGGVWAGMSGSPVYTADGHLIGSVSYGLAASSPIAGITPAATMIPLLTGGTPTPGDPSLSLAKKVSVTSSQAKSLAKVSGLAESTTGRGFSALATPFGVSGTPSAAGQKLLGRFEKKLGKVAQFTGGGKAAAALDTAAVPAVHAGGNFAGVLSYGDASFYGVGTTTFVCSGRAVAFGHPFFYEGDTAMGANLADTIYVQPDPTWGPFKVTNITDTVGTVNLDSLTGIAATLGTAPAGVPVTSTLRNSAGRVFHGQSTIANNEFSPDIAAYSVLYNAERALGASSKGSGSFTFTINGKRANGTPFTVTYKTALADRYNVAYATADLAYVLVSTLTYQDLEDVTLTSIDVSGSISKRVSAYKASKFQVRRSGAWQSASKGPFKVASQSSMWTRVTLTNVTTGASKYLSLKVAIPRVPSGSSGWVNVEAGTSPWDWDFSDASTFSALLKELNTLPVANALYGTVTFPTETSFRETHASHVIATPILNYGDSADLVTP